MTATRLITGLTPPHRFRILRIDMTARGPVLALLADIKDHPDEDGLRLILADWLDEHGDEQDRLRAELIRCQVDYERLSPDRPEKAEAGRRARFLQQSYGPTWLGPLASWLPAWAFSRGLLSVSLETGSLQGQTLTALAASETWAWVEDVVLLATADRDIRRLSRCPPLEGIGSLGFRRGTLTATGLAALSDLPLARRLRTLHLNQCNLAGLGVEVLSAFSGLYHLELSRCELQANVFRHLTEQASTLPNLRNLVLWGNHLSCAAMIELSETEPRPNLRRLDLRANGLTNVGGMALARWPGLATLRELNLADNHIGPKGATALAESGALKNIESLVLWGNPVGTEAAQRLRERFGPRVHVSGGSS